MSLEFDCGDCKISVNIVGKIAFDKDVSSEDERRDRDQMGTKLKIEVEGCEIDVLRRITRELGYDDETRAKLIEMKEAWAEKRRIAEAEGRAAKRARRVAAGRA